MKRRRLGQHYLLDRWYVKRIIDLASPKSNEKILEVGCGKGALTREVLERGYKLVGYEVDKENFTLLKNEFKSESFELILGDAFLHEIDFDVLISSIPYSESSRFVEWLCRREYNRAVVVLQSDFANKLISSPNSSSYRAVSVIAQICAEIKREFDIPRDAFQPTPRVNSCVVSFLYKRRLSKEEMAFIKELFAHRRKKLNTVLKMLGCREKEGYQQRRVYSLTPEEVLSIVRERI